MKLFSLGVCALLAVSTWSACLADVPRPSENVVLKQHCFARFCLLLPADMQRVSDEHQVQDVRIDEKRWHNPSHAERSREFESRLAHIQPLVATEKASNSLRGNVLERRLVQQPTMQTALYHWDDNPFMATWGGLLASGAVDVWLQTDTELSADRTPPARLQTLARAYRMKELSGLSGKDATAYHLRFGQLLLPFLGMESATVRFEHPSQAGTLKITTTTLNAARPFNLQERLAMRVNNAERPHVRVVAGMAGEETMRQIDELGRQSWQYRWTYVGDPQNALRPQFSIQWDTPQATQADPTKKPQKDANLAIWNQLLDSLRLANASGSGAIH